MKVRKYSSFAMAIMAVCLLSGCLKLEVAASDKPIQIDMNIKIEHEIKIKVDRQIEALLKDNLQLFGEGQAK